MLFDTCVHYGYTFNHVINSFRAIGFDNIRLGSAQPQDNLYGKTLNLIGDFIPKANDDAILRDMLRKMHCSINQKNRSCEVPLDFIALGAGAERECTPFGKDMSITKTRDGVISLRSDNKEHLEHSRES